MPKNVITSRVKPQLIRRASPPRVPNIVKIITKSNTTNLQELGKRQLARQPVQQQAQPEPDKNKSASVSNKGYLKRRGTRNKKPRVQYNVREPDFGATEKIKALQGIGRGKILVIFGNGPSLSEAPIECLKNNNKIHTLSINKPDQRIWPTTYWSFFDLSQLRRHEDLWNSYEGKIFNSTAIRKQKQSSMQFKNIRGQGWSRDPSKGIYIGRSSVYASMQIAAWMGYSHVYILGVDMNPEGINGKLHFYGINPDVEPESRAKRFQKEAEWYATAAEILSKEEREKFTFLTEYNPWEFVKKYSLASHKDLSIILNHAAEV